MDLEQIQQLIQVFEKSGLTKIVWRQGDLEIVLEKGAQQVVSLMRENIPTVAAAPTAPVSTNKESFAAAPSEPEGKSVISPMVGTFYASAGPGQSPFVKVGDVVDEKTVVCIVEAMKVMNEVKAGMQGTIAEIYHTSGQPVEYGTPLFRIV